MRMYSDYLDVVARAIRMSELEHHAPKGAKRTELVANTLEIKQAYTIWFSIFLDFGLDLGMDANALLARCVRCVKSMTYTELATCMSSIYDDARRARLTTYSAFKRRYPAEVVKLLRPWLERWTQTWDPYWLSNVATLTTFPFRTRVEDSNLQDEMLSRFLRTEEELARPHRLPDAVVSELNDIIRTWLSDFHIGEDYSPQHGGGVVAQGRLTCEEKYAALGRNQCVDALLRQAGLNPIDYLPHESRLLVNTSDGEDILNRRYAELKPAQRTARILFVPKKANALRTICCEDVTQMYHQKGVQKCIYDYIFRHPYLRTHIPLRDQEIPRRLCQIGSSDGSLGTIDLSEASDRIQWSLVKQVFAGTEYLRWCMATRDTSFVLPDGSTIEPKKFAPMGSALCFPTMSLLLAACVEYVMRRTYCQRNAWSVYGDDIIVPVEAARPLMVLLAGANLVVNKEKSFVEANQPYRESCGIECFNGVDVTPFRFPRTFTATDETVRAKSGQPKRLPGSRRTVKHITPSEFAALTEMANRAIREYNLPFTRYVIVKQLMRRSMGRPLFFTGGSTTTIVSPITGEKREQWSASGLYSPQPTNFHVEQRRSSPPADVSRPFYCCDSVRVWTVSTRKRAGGDEGALGDQMRYFAWLLRANSRRDDSPVFAADTTDPYAFRHFVEPCLKMTWQLVDH